MTDLLRAVRDHAAMRRAVDADFDDAVLRAYEAMCGDGELRVVPRIAEAAGVTRQAIYYRLQRLLRNVDRSDNRGSFREERENGE